jgi:UPF0716 family protein affecting phage T7 exclusion
MQEQVCRTPWPRSSPNVGARATRCLYSTAERKLGTHFELASGPRLQLRSPEVANTLGAALLVVPGFLTDVLGAALLVPIGRQWVAGVLAKAAARPERGAGVIELAPGEWHHVADPEPPRRRAERQEP